MNEAQIAEKLALEELAKTQEPLPEPTVTRVATKEERQLKKVEDCDKLILNLPYQMADGLLRQAEFRKLTIEAYALQLLKESLETKIGQPIITGPSSLNGSPVTKKVSGPTFAVSRTDV